MSQQPEVPPEPCKEITPHENHRWLMQFAGEWTIESEAVMAQDKPPMKSTGTESVRAMGGLWIIGEGQMQMPGNGSMESMMLTMGYDPQQECFVGSWVGTMMTHLWTYSGSLDADRRILTLDCEGPGMAGGMAKYQDVYELVDSDHRILRSQILGEDGSWTRFMEAHYRRK